MWNWIRWAVMLVALLCLAGCAVVTRNQSEAGLRYGTELTFFSRASQTSPETAESKLTIPVLEKAIEDATTPTPSDGN